MTGASLLFAVFAMAACGGAIAVVLSQNVVRMAVWLIVALGGAAGLFFLLHADFVAATQLLVYVGGTIVLLIFGVMLTASGPYLRIKTSPGEGFLSAGVGLLFLAMIFSTVLSVDWHRTGLQLAGLGEQSEASFDAVLKGEGTNEKDAQLLETVYRPVEKSNGTVFVLMPPAKLTQSQAARIATLFGHPKHAATLTGADKGNTARPLGLAFIGLRPDKDLGKSPDAAPTPGYLLPFEIVSVHLLVVLVGAAYLARAKRRTGVPAAE